MTLHTSISILASVILQHSSSISNNINGTQNASTTTPNLPCDPRVFDIPPHLSTRPQVNISNFNGFCPESIFVPIIAWTEIALFFPIFTLSFIGIIWKRKSGHIQARNLSTLIPTLLATLITVFPTLRWAIGRDIFPCGLLLLILFNAAWANILPSILANLTFIIRNLMYRLLTGNFQNNSTSTNATSTAYTAYTTTTNGDRNSLKIDVKDLANTMEEMQQAAESVLPKSSITRTLSSASQFGSTNNQPQQQLEQDISGVTKSTSCDTSTTVGQLDFTPTQVKLFKLYKFLLSAKFRIMTYLFLLIVHVSLWLIMGIIQLAVPNVVAEHYTTGINNFVGGCWMHPRIALMFSIQFGTFLGLNAILLFISFFMEKDTWGIKIETSITSILLLIAVVTYLVCPYITIIRTYTDYFFPYGQALNIYTLLQPLILVTIPLCRAIVRDRNRSVISENAFTMFEKILLNKETFKIALDFSRRSYCSESILCFDCIENYKKCRKKSNKIKIVKHILNTYLTVGAPMELNIDKIEDRFNSLQQCITDGDEKKMSEEIEQLRTHCLQDMSEMMYRLILCNNEIKDVAITCPTVLNTSTPIEEFKKEPCSPLFVSNDISRV